MNRHEEVVGVGGVRFRALRYGHRAPGRVPLLLLHGFTGTAGLWEPLADTLAQDREVIAVDLPGHGGTETEGGHYLFAAQARAVAALCHWIGKCHLLGYSMGGRIALGSAIHAAAHLRSLVLESTHPGLAKQAERLRRIADDARWIAQLERGSIAGFAEAWLERPIFASRRSLPEALRGQIRSAILRQNPLELAQALAGAGLGQQPNLLLELPNLKVPLLSLAGEKDDFFCSHGARMAAVAPQGQFTAIASAGHAPHWENPTAFVETIRRFLSAADSTLHALP